MRIFIHIFTLLLSSYLAICVFLVILCSLSLTNIPFIIYDASIFSQTVVCQSFKFFIDKCHNVMIQGFKNLGNNIYLFDRSYCLH